MYINYQQLITLMTLIAINDVILMSSAGRHSATSKPRRLKSTLSTHATSTTTTMTTTTTSDNVQLLSGTSRRSFVKTGEAPELEAGSIDKQLIPTSPVLSPKKNACDEMTCPRNKVCMLNIQGLPMCRCPSAQYHCKRVHRRPVCTEHNQTFNNKCLLHVEECQTNRRIRVAHRGPCRNGSGGTDRKYDRQ